LHHLLQKQNDLNATFSGLKLDVDQAKIYFQEKISTNTTTKTVTLAHPLSLKQKGHIERLSLAHQCQSIISEKQVEIVGIAPKAKMLMQKVNTCVANTNTDSDDSEEEEEVEDDEEDSDDDTESDDATSNETDEDDEDTADDV